MEENIKDFYMRFIEDQTRVFLNYIRKVFLVIEDFLLFINFFPIIVKNVFIVLMLVEKDLIEDLNISLILILCRIKGDNFTQKKLT